MDLEPFIKEYEIPLLMIFSLLVLLVYLRVSGHSRNLIEGSPGDSSDPVAEAELYLAYGKYDEAAQAIRKALVKEPLSADLVFKLIEIHFGSGSSDEFLSQARFYKSKFGRSVHWNAICRMGQELLPEESLFR